MSDMSDILDILDILDIQPVKYLRCLRHFRHIQTLSDTFRQISCFRKIVKLLMLLDGGGKRCWRGDKCE